MDVSQDKLIIINAAEVVTCKGGPKRGLAMNDLGILPGGAIFIVDGIIHEVGATADLLDRIKETGCRIIDASNKCVLPGFVDSHTHFLFAGDNIAEEFSRRLCGNTDWQFLEQGGGLAHVIHATRRADKDQLKSLARPRLDALLALGVTTVEGKSGYGLDVETEIKQLEAMQELNSVHPLEIISTFFGASTVPKRYAGHSADYIHYLIEQVLPLVAVGSLAAFCDILCAADAFSPQDANLLLRTARKYGLQLKIHADDAPQLNKKAVKFSSGTSVAAELNAISADGLVHISAEDMQQLAIAGTVATLLPLNSFALRKPYAKGREMIDRGIIVALATGLNPENCCSESIPLLLALASLQMEMTPAEAITALTINGAAALGKASTIGSIEPGKQADLLILEHPSHKFLTYRLGVSIVEQVIKQGCVVWRKHI